MLGFPHECKSGYLLESCSGLSPQVSRFSHLGHDLSSLSVIKAWLQQSRLSASRIIRHSPCLQDPKVSAHHFDWIAAPKHDGLTGPNVTTTLGAVHGVNPVRVAEAKEPFASLIGWLPRPRITVLLGGSSRAFRFTAPDAENFGRSLATMARENNGSRAPHYLSWSC